MYMTDQLPHIVCPYCNKLYMHNTGQDVQLEVCSLNVGGCGKYFVVRKYEHVSYTSHKIED